MKKNPLIPTSGGFTLMELMIVVAIIAILVAILGASYKTIMARMRYSNIRSDMSSIIKVAQIDFAGSRDNAWALNVLTPGDPPSFVGPTSGFLKWPAVPCGNWFYNWENYSAIPGLDLVRVTIHNESGAALWSYCLQNFGANCMADDGTGTPIDINTLPASSRYIYCSE